MSESLRWVCWLATRSRSKAWSPGELSGIHEDAPRDVDLAAILQRDQQVVRLLLGFGSFSREGALPLFERGR